MSNIIVGSEDNKLTDPPLQRFFGEMKGGSLIPIFLKFLPTAFFTRYSKKKRIFVCFENFFDFKVLKPSGKLIFNYFKAFK